MYAVGGKTRIVMSSSGSPEEALEKARQLRAAANAPSEPSGQDMAVASQASKMEADALQQIAKRKNAPDGGNTGSKLPASFRSFDRTA